MTEQNFANHVRYQPIYHFFILPVVAINVLVALWFIVRRPSLLTAWNLVFALAIVSLALVVRISALTNQNRIIRLEERLRLAQLLPDELRARISEITTRDLIALRFCSDEELPELTRAVLAGECHGRDIKQRIRAWRPDYHRV